jgi:phosphate transport system ATP-binding protein
MENVSVYYEGKCVLSNVNLEIPEKQLTVIMGPSGCGKTTLLKSLNRMIDLESDVKIDGKIIIDGVNILDRKTDATAIRKKLGYICQTPNPLPMSIYDNLAYGPRIHGTKNKVELNSIVEKCLAAAGLWNEVSHRLKDPASKLSLGQQQRLCIARALTVEPEVLLCDEPTSALDPISAKHIEEQLLALKNDYTTVLVTHTLRQARRLADYVVFIYLGQIVEYGPAKQLFDDPKEPKTRAYIKEGIEYIT